ncbi:hypothetical protein CAPN002_17920 [Capnocytophaga stomatis]|nr:hypothetical protein CAPN002_17920 [Capnocytophaga stomatis]
MIIFRKNTETNKTKKEPALVSKLLGFHASSKIKKSYKQNPANNAKKIMSRFTDFLFSNRVEIINYIR